MVSHHAHDPRESETLARSGHGASNRCFIYNILILNNVANLLITTVFLYCRVWRFGCESGRCCRSLRCETCEARSYALSR